MSSPLPGLARKNFCARLRELRDDAGLTQGQLAEKVGLGRAAVTNLESGSTRPSVDVFCDLARAFGVSLDYLACFDGAPKPPQRWVADLAPDLETLPQAGRVAVRVIVKGYPRPD